MARAMTLKQKEKIVARAEKKLREAAEALSDLQMMARQYGVDTDREMRFAEELRERAGYWETCSWWRIPPNQ